MIFNFRGTPKALIFCLFFCLININYSFSNDGAIIFAGLIAGTQNDIGSVIEENLDNLNIDDLDEFENSMKRTGIFPL